MYGNFTVPLALSSKWLGIDYTDTTKSRRQDDSSSRDRDNFEQSTERLLRPSVDMNFEANSIKRSNHVRRTTSTPGVVKKRSRMRPLRQSSYAFTNVCVGMNSQDEDQGLDNGQRTIVWFDPSDKYEKRCVSCNNPVMSFEWNQIADYVSALSPGWHEEGGLLRDSGRPCGMMWDNVMVAHDLDDARTCRAHHHKEISDRGQLVGMQGMVHRPRAAVLQWYHGNPGHQLLDCILSQLDLFRTYNGPFESHQTCGGEKEEWYCVVVGMLGVTIAHVAPDTLACYDEALVPRLGIHGREGGVPLEGATWRWFRQRIGAASTLPSTTHVLMYAHNSTSRRVWLNMEEHVTWFRSRGISVQVVSNFAAHSVVSQAHIFKRATHLIMPHGGQWANIIFSARGAHMWELSCTGYSHITQGLPMDTWDHHAVNLYDHAGCKDTDMYGNFTVPLALSSKWLGIDYTDTTKSMPNVQLDDVQRPDRRRSTSSPVTLTRSSGTSFMSQVVVSAQVTNSPRYVRFLRAQLDTWLGRIPEERRFVVGPQSGDTHGLWTRSNCSDRDMSCKRLMSIYNGYLALRDGVDFKWLLTFNEDQYVMVEHVLEHLEDLNPDEKMILSGIGCGRRWEYVNPGKPRPDDWGWSPRSCSDVEHHGGICGGFGIFFSRAAVEAFFVNGASAFWQSSRRYLPAHRAAENPSYKSSQDDDGVACLSYDWNIPLKQWSYEVGEDLREENVVAEEDLFVLPLGSMYHMRTANATRFHHLDAVYLQSIS
jgi:hypothetical protein